MIAYTGVILETNGKIPFRNAGDNVSRYVPFSPEERYYWVTTINGKHVCLSHFEEGKFNETSYYRLLDADSNRVVLYSIYEIQFFDYTKITTEEKYV